MSGRDYLHQLIDALPDSLVAEVVDFAEFVAQKARAEQASVVRAAFAELPEDDEDLSQETTADLEEADRAIASGDLTSSADMKRELGLL